MKQKFKAYSFVRVCDEMPPEMKHFESGFDAIVQYTYSQGYGGSDVKKYSLYVIKDDKIVNNVSWYKEYQLTLINEDFVKAQEMVEEYNLKK